MADRILTKGLKTGTGVGGVKWILRRGLVPASIILVSRRDTMAIEREGNIAAVTPSDTEDLPNSGILYVGGAGNIKVTAINGGTAILLGVPAGTWVDRIRVKKVFATGGTTATSIIVAW